MITYKEVYEHRHEGKVEQISFLNILHNIIKDKWLFTCPNTPYDVVLRDEEFIPSEYFIAHDKPLANLTADIEIIIRSTYQVPEKQTFVMGRIYNEGSVTYSRTIKHYLYRIKE